MNKSARSIALRGFAAILGLTLFCVLVSPAHAQTGAPNSKTYKFNNGNWFDGKTFKRKTFYSINGFLTKKRPARIDETIDLENGFVIPPFADAHCHHFDSAYNVEQQTEMYLRDGVFYAKVQTNVRTGAAAVRDKVNNPMSVDVAYAHGALTHSYGHGIEIYEALALGFYGDYEKYKANIPTIAASRIRDNDAYYIIDTRADLEAKWQKILDGKPDFLKVYLVKSEDYQEKSKNILNIEFGNIGIDPQLLPAIVSRERAASLRVSAHVDTVTDYRIALNAGVNEMAHLPGYYPVSEQDAAKYLLTAADARETAKRAVWNVPAPASGQAPDPSERQRRDRVLRNNLSLLKKYRAKIAFGSDRYGSTPVDDVADIKNLGVFSNLELLKIWCEATAQTVFPNRRIGRLREGYEASFLLLTGDPLAYFGQTKNIKLRFKQGFLIRESKAQLPPAK